MLVWIYIALWAIALSLKIECIDPPAPKLVCSPSWLFPQGIKMNTIHTIYVLAVVALVLSIFIAACIIQDRSTANILLAILVVSVVLIVIAVVWSRYLN